MAVFVLRLRKRSDGWKLRGPWEKGESKSQTFIIPPAFLQRDEDVKNHLPTIFHQIT